MADVVKLVVHSHVQGRDVQNTFYYQAISGSPGPGSPTDLAAWFIANVIPVWQNAVSAAMVFDMVEASALDELDAAVDQIILSDTFGVMVSVALPDHNVVRVNKISFLVGPEVKRGAILMSGIPYGATTGNNLGSIYVLATLQPFLDAMQMDAVGLGGPSDWSPAVAYRDRSGYIREENVDVSPGVNTTFTITDGDFLTSGFVITERTSIRGVTDITGTYETVAVTDKTIEVTGDVGFQGTAPRELTFNQAGPLTTALQAGLSASPVIKTLKNRRTRYESAYTGVVQP